MAYRFNIFTGTLDIVGSSSSGGSVTGIPPTDVNAIARWADTTGTTIQNSLTVVQDGGAIEAQGFITHRSVTALVVIPDGESWIAPSLELELTGSIELEPNGELIIV
jgi:hypothetical protein